MGRRSPHSAKAGKAAAGLAAPCGLLAFLLASLASALSVMPALGAAGGQLPGGPALHSERGIVGALGDEVVQRPDGLYAVRVPGGDLLTHGPDPAAVLRAPSGSAFAPATRSARPAARATTSSTCSTGARRAPGTATRRSRPRSGQRCGA